FKTNRFKVGFQLNYRGDRNQAWRKKNSLKSSSSRSRQWSKNEELPSSPSLKFQAAGSFLQLRNTPFERQVKQKIVINLKPVIERLDVQGTILCSLQSDVNSIFMSQASSSKEISSIRNAMKWLNNEMSSMKTMLSEILKVVGAHVTPPHPPPATQVPESGPSGSSVPVFGLAAAEAEVNEQGSSGPAEQDKGPQRPAEKMSGPSGSLEFELVQNLAEEEVLVPEPPAPTSSQTLVPQSPPSSSTAPPAPQTFKKPQPRTISSPTPFPSQSTSSAASSPVSSTIVSPLPSSPPKLPPASSSAGPSSSGPSTSDTFTLPTETLDSIFNPPTPPSFITIISEGAQLAHVQMQDIKDEFEVAILRSVLAVGTHTHRTGSSSPISKKRRLTSTHPVSSENCYPPLWFSLSISNKQKPIYEEYLQKLGQFRAAIRALSSSTAHTEPLQVDFATLVISDVVFLPPLHALIMDSSVGTLIFERAVRVMARLFVQDGRDLSFPRFVFRQYLQGHIKADVLAPILSECGRLSPEEWQKLCPLSAQQLSDLNASQASSNQPLLSPGEFLDANSLHLIRDSYLTGVERYKVFFALKQELRSLKIDYPLKLEAFLRFASFGSFLTYKLALGRVNSGRRTQLASTWMDVHAESASTSMDANT
ncbi:hypothetical protein Taro_046319, partial [Colocasia esculenta]|nr:hypothetical protein [Colocasia esculenta]